MKRLTGITWTLCLLPLVWSGCYNLGPCVNGQGDVVTTEIELDPFDRIDLASAGEVFITQGNAQRVTVESNANVIERLNKSVNSGEWFIGFKSCINYRTLKI